MKTRIILISVLLAMASFTAYSAVSAFLSPNLALEKEEGLSERSIIAVKAEAEGNVFHLGDAFSYYVKVRYNPDKIEEIDKKSLDNTVILDPFKVRDVKEKDVRINSNTRLYTREYTIQLIDGPTNRRYPFPSIIVRYKEKHFSWSEKVVIPQPVFIGAGVPAKVFGPELRLKPLKEKVINVDYERIPWLLWGLAGLCLSGALLVVVKKFRKQRGEKKDYQRRREGLADLFEAYEDLSQKVSRDEDPKILLHRAHQVLRTLLVRRENIDWLDPQLDSISDEKSKQVSELLKRCQQAYGLKSVEKKDAEIALELLKEIIDFYFAKGEV